MKFSIPANVAVSYRWLRIDKKIRRLLILKPKDLREGERLPGVFWIHGGGYFCGFPEMVFMGRAADLASRGRAIVVSPSYPLSFTSPYPDAIRECHKMLRYMKEHAKELCVSSDQIMVGGESAGGGMTAALCMFAKDHHTVNIAFQMPIYPMLDCRDTDSSRDNHGKIWNTRRNHLAWKLYLRRIRDKERVPCYASPALRKDYSGLPPCYTFVGDLEPFYDETLTYAEKLRKAGVDAEVDVYEGFYHAYDMMRENTPEARKAADRFIEVFRRACGTCFAPQEDEAKSVKADGGKDQSRDR